MVGGHQHQDSGYIWVKMKYRQQRRTPLTPWMKLYVWLPCLLCGFPSQSSRCCLAVKYSLPRLRTLCVTPQWDSMGWHVGGLVMAGRSEFSWCNLFTVVGESVSEGGLCITEAGFWGTLMTGTAQEESYDGSCCPPAFCWPSIQQTFVKHKLCTTGQNIKESKVKELDRFVK